MPAATCPVRLGSFSPWRHHKGPGDRRTPPSVRRTLSYVRLALPLRSPSCRAMRPGPFPRPRSLVSCAVSSRAIGMASLVPKTTCELCAQRLVQVVVMAAAEQGHTFPRRAALVPTCRSKAEVSTVNVALGLG